MSRKLAVVTLAMFVLAGAMALKTAVTVQGSDAVLTANNGTSPPPLPPTHQGHSRNGTSPAPLPPKGQGQ